MDFVLGILTGFGIALYIGHYYSQRDKKKSKKTTVKEGLGIYIDGKFVAACGPPVTYQGFRQSIPKTNLEEQLSNALNREDFEEAARLRDLINKQ